MSAAKKGRQGRFKKFGQPAPVWPWFMQQAAKRIGERKGFSKKLEAVDQIAAEIVRGGDGPAFLKAVRRGRATQRQNIRYRLLREVERLIGPSVPRRREDRNTPEAQKFHGQGNGQFSALHLAP
jgi:hypothetical protein